VVSDDPVTPDFVDLPAWILELTQAIDIGEAGG